VPSLPRPRREDVLLEQVVRKFRVRQTIHGRPEGVSCFLRAKIIEVILSAATKLFSTRAKLYNYKWEVA
jgi:hypothetical protein